MPGSRNHSDLIRIFPIKNHHTNSLPCLQGELFAFFHKRKSMNHYFFIPTPLGELTVCEENEKLTQICWGHIIPTGTSALTPLIREAECQIRAYFAHRLTFFDLPYQLNGTDFQKQVWQAISHIPYGTTLSYQELSRQCRQEKACRATGNACGKNPLVVLIPCHRVIRQNGTYGNYHGGQERKRLLLELESNRPQLFPLSVINL